ncbi:magnesium chelatase [Lacihabitans sp. CS3-21]|jgi:magnesium chelatase subunit I|uniref:magnesium chelatase n=1 Tax=Lacihabitans sp. CS3-21 TaxID=2487332 RepID=UPI000BCA8F17|nr:magnesium chelatase [Lacihabitans sp. CS3-21]MCP9748032.1 magnesium chelatase [Lacihabitans sp. CS3-21]MDP1817018.1 magnesium chelatase [Leadbetterella sp.]OYU65829.1 MAG: magnesium chelatase [Cytophagaceae bacterium BCCC1]
MELLEINTLGQLKKHGYKSKSIKEELRDNLIKKLQNKENIFEGIWGYENTVIPEIEKAILSMHNINLLGLRGQAKTRIARLFTHLLDEHVPIILGSELNDDPLKPISRYGRDLVKELGDETPVAWLHRNERYSEKLATPDVSVADLIGDVDPIKAATLKLPYSDERVIHFGLIPRSNRCVFVINELPDLQARIQVALFNILQEGDVQIRGFKLWLPLDIQFVFTANPEDYTNRGSIVTPLKDRIDSQIITHYPKSIEIGKKITQQEAKRKDGQKGIFVNEILQNLIEKVAIEARNSEFVDAKSGVSARMTISAFENLLSSAELRALKNGDKKPNLRLSDIYGAISAINGKIELVYEGELEGPVFVAHNLIGKAIRSEFIAYFPNPEKRKSPDYKKIVEWFGNGNSLTFLSDENQKAYKQGLRKVDGLLDLVERFFPEETAEQKDFLMEFVLHGMAEYSLISKQPLDEGVKFNDLLDSMLSKEDFE